MNALEFLKERKRMRDSYKSCEGCPFDDSKCSLQLCHGKDRDTTEDDDG